MSEQFRLKTGKKKKLAVEVFHPRDEAKAVVVAVHGMAEHSGRYRDLARYLSGRGFVVYIYDQREHRESRISTLPRGLGSLRENWEVLMDDLMQLEGLAEARHPGLPVFVLGHSMGSLLARCFAADYGRDLAGLVLSGTPADPGITGMAGQILATLMLAAGLLRENRTLDRLLFGRGNARIPEAKTPFDWLTRDDTAVSTYMEDPDCGFVYPTAFYHELIRGARLAWSTGTFRGTPPELPVYLLGGDEDPMGNYGQALRDAADRYRKAGLQDVTVRLYPGGRHEMFNELNREDVFRETALWMEEKIVNWKG